MMILSYSNLLQFLLFLRCLVDMSFFSHSALDTSYSFANSIVELDMADLNSIGVLLGLDNLFIF